MSRKLLKLHLVFLKTENSTYNSNQLILTYFILYYNYIVLEESLNSDDELGSWIIPNNSYKPITNTPWVRARLCKLQKGCTRLATQVIKLTSCFPMVGGSLPVLRLLPPLKLVAVI